MRKFRTAHEGGFEVEKKPKSDECPDEDDMRLASLGDGDPIAKAILDAVRVKKPKESDSDSGRSN